MVKLKSSIMEVVLVVIPLFGNIDTFKNNKLNIWCVKTRLEVLNPTWMPSMTYSLNFYIVYICLMSNFINTWYTNYSLIPQYLIKTDPIHRKEII